MGEGGGLCLGMVVGLSLVVFVYVGGFYFVFFIFMVFLMLF